MTIRNPHPAARRDLGERSWTFTSAKKNLGRAIVVRPTRDLLTMHQTLGTREVAEDEGAQSEFATSDARQRHSEGHGPRWRARTTLLLIVSVGALFWGALIWLILR